MRFERRQILIFGGGSVAALSIPSVLRAGDVEVVEMKGTTRGEKVWFAPQGLAVQPDTKIRFENHDPGNSHTSTAYDPTFLNRQRRIPLGATPWDSDYLLPGESFEVILTVPGVYDFYCQPHEHAGMVGRIVVGRPGESSAWQGAAPDSDDLPPAALNSFPSVEDILAQGKVIARVAK